MKALSFRARCAGRALQNSPTTNARVSARGYRLVTSAEYKGGIYEFGIYPEWGSYPGSPEDETDPAGPLGNAETLSAEKLAEIERMHGRWAMLGVTGAIAQENGTGIPWFAAGVMCTPDDCLSGYSFPGAVAPLAPEGSGYPSFFVVVILEVVLMGLAEAYRTGLSDNPLGLEPTIFPGGKFDPLGFSKGEWQDKLIPGYEGEDLIGDLGTLKVKELKHGRLAMFAWLGCISQAINTNPDGLSGALNGPMKNLADHQADPWNNLLK